MEITEVIGVPYLKKGSGIHIKKKNRGKFTKYCNGKVTQKCIDKAKKSGNKTLVKRAVFADNARKWKYQEGGSVYPDWMIPDKFKDVEFVEKIMKRNSHGNWKDFFGGMKNINSGSRIVGSYTPGYLRLKERPTPNNSRDLISQYLHGKSSLVPYKNPTPIIINGQELTGDQFEGKIFLEDTMRLPEHMKDMVEDYIKNNKIISVNSNDPIEGEWYSHDNKGKTYDNTRSHYISLKRDKDGNIYADIFDRWDFDHNRLGRTLEKYHGTPFILRQKVPVEFTESYDYNTMSYLQNIHGNTLKDLIKYGKFNTTSSDFKYELNKNFNKDRLKVENMSPIEYYLRTNDEFNEYEY